MKIERLPSGSYQIWMTDADMQRWGLRFETMGAQDAATRAAIRRLLQLLGHRGLWTNGVSLTVEAVPIEQGCLLLFSPKREWPLCAVLCPQIYALNSAGEVLQLGQALGETETLPSASLFLWGEEYRLIVYPDPRTSRCEQLPLSEFAQPIAQGHTAAAFTEEHGQTITVGNALHRLREACATR